MIVVLMKFFRKLGAFGLKLNKSKCVFGVTKLKFVGHIIGPDPEKVSVIVDMPLPTNKKELQDSWAWLTT